MFDDEDVAGSNANLRRCIDESRNFSGKRIAGFDFICKGNWDQADFGARFGFVSRRSQFLWVSTSSQAFLLRKGKAAFGRPAANQALGAGFAGMRQKQLQILRIVHIDRDAGQL